MRKSIESFADRLLSTKLVTLVIMWSACFISFWSGKMADSQFVTVTLGIGGLIVAASYVDKKTEKTGTGVLFDKDVNNA